MNLLLIEPYGPLARSLQRGLEEEGYAVEVAGDARSGDHQARTGGPDVIVIDLVGLRADGDLLLRRWRQADLNAHVLALVAPGGGGPPGGADSYLALPFRLEELLAHLRGVTRGAVAR